MLSAELISKLAGFSAVQNYGIAPDAQHGVDLIATHDNTIWGFQCKRVQRFGRSEFARVLSAATYKAEKFVLILSCPATTSLIEAVSEHDGRWELWDSRELDRKILALPDAYEFVDAYFGQDYASAFVGKRRAGIFLTPEEFFKPLLGANRATSLVGDLIDRTDHVQAVTTFLQGLERVLILSGPVGVGKTKVLYETTKDHAGDETIRFIREAADMDEEAIAEIPRTATIVIVDDVERTGRLGNLISNIVRAETTKLVLSTTSENRQALALQVQAYGFDASEIIVLPDLKGLSRNDTYELAKQSFDNANTLALDMAYTVSSGIPLIVRIMSFLVNQGDHNLLEALRAEEHPIDVVLAKYDEVLRGRTLEPQGIRPEDALDAMRLISAVGPVDVRTAAFSEKAAAFLTWDAHRLADVLNALSLAGIIVRSGSKSRIVPELLRMFILKRACLAGNRSTGYAERIVAHFGYDHQLVVNLALVDRVSSEPDAVFGTVWSALERDIRESYAFERLVILDEIRDLGYLMPRKVLALVDFVMNNPAAVDPEQPLRSLHEYNNDDVLRKLAPIISTIAYSDLALVPRSVQLLWRLGRDEEKTYSHNSAYDALLDLAKYGRYKSVRINLEVLKELQVIAASDAEQAFRHLPIDVVEPVLAKSFYSSETVGAKLTVTKAMVAAENVALVRSKGIDILEQALKSSNLRNAVRSVALLASCLRPLEGQASDNATGIWEAEKKRVLDLLASAVNDDRSIVRLTTITALSWHAQLDSDMSVRERCAEIVATSPGAPELEFLAALVPDFARKLPNVKVGSSYDELQTAIDSLLKRVIKRILEEELDPAALATRLSGTIDELETAGIHASAGWFFIELANADLAYAERVADRIVDRFGGALGTAIGPVVHRAWIEDRSWADAFVARALASQQPPLYLGIANALWQRGPQPADAQSEAQRRANVLSRLFEMDRSDVREAALRAIGTVVMIDKHVGLQLILELGVGRDPKITDELFANLRGFDADDIGLDNVDKLLETLVGVSDLDYWVFAFLQKVAHGRPVAVLDLLLKRVEHYDEAREQDRDFKPVPYGRALLPHVVMFFKELNLSVASLLEALDRGFALNGMQRYWFSHLVSNVTLRPEPLAQAFIDWGYGTSAERVEFAADALHEAPAEFIFGNVQLVATLIDIAYTFGDECGKHVRSAVFAAITGGARSGVAFQPMPQDVSMIASARAARNTLTAGSPAERFFEDVERYGEQSVTRQHELDVDTFGDQE